MVAPTEALHSGQSEPQRDILSLKRAPSPTSRGLEAHMLDPLPLGLGLLAAVCGQDLLTSRPLLFHPSPAIIPLSNTVLALARCPSQAHPPPPDTRLTLQVSPQALSAYPLKLSGPLGSPPSL